MYKFLVVAMMVWAGSAFAAIDSVNGGVDTFDGTGLADDARLTTEMDALQWSAAYGANVPAGDGFIMDTAPSQQSASFTNTAVLPSAITHALFPIHTYSGGTASTGAMILAREKEVVSDLTVKYSWYIALDSSVNATGDTAAFGFVGLAFGDAGVGAAQANYAQNTIRVNIGAGGGTTKDLSLETRQLTSDVPTAIVQYQVGLTSADDTDYAFNQWIKVTLEVDLSGVDGVTGDAIGTVKLYLDDVLQTLKVGDPAVDVDSAPIRRAAASPKTHFPILWLNNKYDSDTPSVKGKLYVGAVELDTMNVPAPEVSVLDGTTEVANGGTIDVGAVVLDSTTLEKTITIKNTGTLDLTTSDLAVTGDFALKAGETLEATLIPDATDDVVVEMATTVLGAKTGTLTFTTNDADEGSVSINLAGEVDAATAVREWHQY